MTTWKRSEYADRIRHAIQAILTQNHIEYSCFVVSRVSPEETGSFHWDVVAMTSRGKVGFTLETTAFDSDEDLAAKAASAVAQGLPLTMCPTCHGIGFLKPEPEPVEH